MTETKDSPNGVRRCRCSCGDAYRNGGKIIFPFVAFHNFINPVLIRDHSMSEG